MSWCPECGAEYREGYTQCSECQVALVDTPPAGAQVETELVEVGAFDTLEQAELAQGLLESSGIPSEVEDGRVPNPELGPQVNGEVALLVPRTMVEQARVLLAEADRGELVDDAEAAEAQGEPSSGGTES